MQQKRKIGEEGKKENKKRKVAIPKKKSKVTKEKSKVPTPKKNTPKKCRVLIRLPREQEDAMVPFIRDNPAFYDYENENHKDLKYKKRLRPNL